MPTSSGTERERVRARLSALNAMLAEHISGIKVTQLFCREEEPTAEQRSTARTTINEILKLQAEAWEDVAAELLAEFREMSAVFDKLGQITSNINDVTVSLKKTAKPISSSTSGHENAATTARIPAVASPGY